MKILLVDDEEDIRLAASVSLEIVGRFKVILATNGKDALSLARKEHPDVILLDVMMPDISGPALLEKLQKDNRTMNIPAIFLTAKTKPADVQRLLDLGAKGVIAKPFDPARLAADVQHILDS